MSLTRRQFTALIAPAAALAGSAATLWPSQSLAQNIKLGSGEVYEFKSSPDLADVTIQIGDVRMNLGQEMAYARRIGVLKEYGRNFALTDDPRAFRLDAATIAQLEIGPVEQNGFRYYCQAGEFGNSYGCEG